MAFKRISWSVVITLILGTWLKIGAAETEPIDSKFIDGMIESLQDALAYYKRDLPDLIVDTAFCLFHTKEILQATLDESAAGETILNDDQVENIRDALFDTDEVLQVTIPNMNYSTEDITHYAKLYSMPMAIPQNIYYLNGTSKASLNHSHSTDNISDQCVWELIGSWPTLDSNPCQISDNCWRFVTHLSGKPFLINHQLLALAVARQFNCQSSLQKKFVQFGGLRGLQNMLCSHVHRTMLQILKSGFNHHVEKDLFLEQIYVCGTLHGFVEFFRLEYIKTIMSWQLESGCFTSNHSDKDVTDLSNSQTEVSILLENRPETKLPDGCYQHMSALATSNIAAYVRWSSSKSRREVKTTPTPHPESKSLPFSVMIAIISVGAVIACILVIGIGYYAYLKSPARSGYLRIKLEDDKKK